MRSEYERRIDRLEDTFGEYGCTCGGGPGLQIIQEIGKTEAQIEAEIGAQRVYCAVHGESGPMVIRLRDVVGEFERAHQVRVTSSGLVLADGRVMPNLPGPQR